MRGAVPAESVVTAVRVATVRIDVFGGLQASVDGATMPPLPLRSGGFLGLLVLAQRRPVGLTELIDWLWGEAAVPSAGNQLQRMVGQLRRRFDPELEPRAQGEVILAINDGYRLGDSVESDLFDLETQLGGAEATTEHRATVLRMIRKPPFAGLERLLANHPAYVAVEHQCASAAIDALDVSPADQLDRGLVDLVDAVAVRFPYEERLQASLVRAFGATGRRSEALALYERVRTSLHDELGVDPGPDLQAAQHTVLTLDALDDDPFPIESVTGPAQLPRVVGGLVARPVAQQLLDRVAEAGEAGAVLVTAIGGMGGIGKTTLAVAWAHQLTSRFPDGQLYLNLRGFDAQRDVMTPQEAVAALLASLGAAAESATVDPGLPAQSALLRSRLAGRRFLLLLDNARDADQVRPLLPGDPTCLAIVTSRNRLSSLVTREGAVPIQLDRMSDDEAEDLLARRLGSEVVRADPDATSAILHACGGLPLALALVATRIALEPRLALRDIAAELRDTDLTAWSAELGADDLRTVFAWSFAALDPATAEAFQLIAAHPAQQMSMSALVSLLGMGAESCASIVRALCDASLLQQIDRQHYTMHDLLRAYARAMPDPDQRIRPAEHRLVSHVVHSARNGALLVGLTHRRMVDDLRPGVRPESFIDLAAFERWVDASQEEVTAATELAVRRGWTRDAANVLCDLKQLARRWGMLPGQQARQLWEVLEAAGGMDSDEAFGDPTMLANVLRSIAFDQKFFGTYEQAQTFLQRAERLLIGTGDRLAQAHVLRAVGNLHQDRKEIALALQAYQRALKLTEDEGETGVIMQARMCMNVANAHFDNGDWTAALEANDRAVAIWRAIHTTGNDLVYSYINRAEILLRLDRADDALEALDASRVAGADASPAWAGYFALAATVALRAGERVRAQHAVDEFHRRVAEQDLEVSAADWAGGLQELVDQIDDVADQLRRFAVHVESDDSRS